jgi:hypothetical protein
VKFTLNLDPAQVYEMRIEDLRVQFSIAAVNTEAK